MKPISKIDSISNEFNQSTDKTEIKINNLIRQIFNVKENQIYNEENIIKAIQRELEKEENYLSDILMINEDVKVNYFTEYVQSLEYTENIFKIEYLENIQNSLFEISETLQLNLDAIKLKRIQSPKYYSVFNNIDKLGDDFSSLSELSKFNFKPELLVQNENDSFNYEPNVFSPNNIKSIITYYLKMETENNVEVLTEQNVTSFSHQLIKAIIQQSAQSNLSNSFSEKFKAIYNFIEENNQQSNTLHFKNQLTSKIVNELELKDLSLDTYLSDLNSLNNKKRNKP